MSIENKSEATLILRSLRKNILKLHLISNYRPDRKRYNHFLLQIIIKCAQSARPHKFISHHWLFYRFICYLVFRIKLVSKELNVVLGGIAALSQEVDCYEFPSNAFFSVQCKVRKFMNFGKVTIQKKFVKPLAEVSL